MRKDWARYADMVTLVDAELAEILSALDADGLAQNTIVFIYSDHGHGMSRSKRWLYDDSLRVPLFIRFPEKYKHLAPAAEGGVDKRLVSFVDLGPTVLSLAGVKPPASMQGKAFLGAHSAPAREWIYGFRDRMDARYDMQRAVRDDRYKLIRNYLPHRPYAQYLAYMYKARSMQAWHKAWEDGLLRGPEKTFSSPSPLWSFTTLGQTPMRSTTLPAIPSTPIWLRKCQLFWTAGCSMRGIPDF